MSDHLLNDNLNDCGCCEGLIARTPTLLENAPSMIDALAQKLRARIQKNQLATILHRLFGLEISQEAVPVRVAGQQFGLHRRLHKRFEVQTPQALGLVFFRQRLELFTVEGHC